MTMPKTKKGKYSKEFGKKEKVLNYTCQTYQLSRPNKVGAVMALIRKCQPKSIEDWESWYFENAYTEGKRKLKLRKKNLRNSAKGYMSKLKKSLYPNGRKHSGS